jgi:hypothetical protein
MRAAQDTTAQPLPHVTYAPRADVSPGAEISALAAVYKLCLNSSHAKKRGRLLDKGGPDDPERRSDEIRAKTRIP